MFGAWINVKCVPQSRKIIADTKNSNINGNIYAVNGSVITGKNIKSKILEANNQDTILINQKIRSTYFEKNVDNYKDSYSLAKNNVNINKAIYSDNTITIKGNINQNAAIGSNGDLTLNGNSLNANNAVLYSETGDINLNFNNTNISGLIYAPYGKVIINSNHVQINGIVIADEIEIFSENFNINNSETVAKFVGNISEDSGDIQLADGKINSEYLCKAILPYLTLDDISINDVLLSDDYDKDGVTLIDEYNNNTNPFNKDSDDDGLDDYSEIYIYKTDPCCPDTDGDVMSDGTEVYSGLNPSNKDSDSDGIYDSEETVTQEADIDLCDNIDINETLVKPHVEITGKGDYRKQIYAEDISYNQALMDINGIIGHPFDFKHDNDLTFDSSKLTFSISDAVLSQYTLDDLAIISYNTDNNSIEVLDTQYDYVNNSISADVSHYSIYAVINTAIYLLNTQYNLRGSIIESGKADIVFVIYTTYYGYTDINNIKTNINHFLDELYENNIDVRLKLITYDTYVTDEFENTYEWDDMVTFRDKINTLDTYSESHFNEYNAFNNAESMNFRPDASKHIIHITDFHTYNTSFKNGFSNNRNLSIEKNHSSDKKLSVNNTDNTDTSNEANDNDIIYSEVSPYVGADPRVVESGGVFATLFSNFGNNLSTLLLGKQNSQDEGCWIRLTNGKIVKLDKNPALGDETVDTDNDGIPDLEELGDITTITCFNFFKWDYVEYNAWEFYSNPAKADTDYDGLNDMEDIAPCYFDIRVIYEDEYCIGFNTSHNWHKIGYNEKYNAIDYMESKNYYYYLDEDGEIIENSPLKDHLIEDLNKFLFGETYSWLLSKEEVDEITMRYKVNKDRDFYLAELEYIGSCDNEGSKLYLNNKGNTLRETIFEDLFNRESKYYRHTDDGSTVSWEEVPRENSGGYFKGYVISEYDSMFSTSIINKKDIYTDLDKLSSLVLSLCFIVTGYYYLGFAVSSMYVLNYYVSNYGIVNGIQFAYYCGASQMENGIISYLGQDYINGDPSTYELELLNNEYYLEVNNGLYRIPYSLSYGEYLQCLNEMYLYGDTVQKTVAEGISEIKAGLSDIIVTSTVQKTAGEINTFWETIGYENPPYKANIPVIQIKLAQETDFVKVYDGVNSGLKGQFVMKLENITNTDGSLLTAQQIKDKYALNFMPKYVADAKIPAGTTMNCGIAGPVDGWGSGGGLQFDLNGNYDVGVFIFKCNISD